MSDIVARFHSVELPRDLTSAYIVPIGDLHFGDPHCDVDKVKRYLAWVAERDNAFILLNGDLANIAIASSVSDTYSETVPVREQRKFLVKLLEPVADRILGMTGGNHEHRITKETGDDITEIIATILGVPYFEDEMWLKVSLGTGRNGKRVAYSIYMTHGFGGGRRPGGKANNLETVAEISGCDVVITSHTHTMMALPLVKFVPDLQNNCVREVKQVAVSTGGYLKRGGYAARFGYKPVKIGSPRIRLDGTRKDAHVSV